MHQDFFLMSLSDKTASCPCMTSIIITTKIYTIPDLNLPSSSYFHVIHDQRKKVSVKNQAKKLVKTKLS